MTEENVQEETQEPEMTELDLLKQRANLMGLKFHPNIGLKKLQTAINSALADEDVDPKLEVEPDTKLKESAAKDKVDHTKVHTPVSLENPRVIKRREAMELIRIRVSCMNPNKSEHDGEVFTTGNRLVGTIKKYVPFNNEAGWHVPRIIYNMMNERRCTVMKTVTENGRKRRVGSSVKEFAIEVLPALTKEQMAKLAQNQAARQAIT